MSHPRALTRMAFLLASVLISLACVSFTPEKTTQSPAPTPVLEVDIPDAKVHYYTIYGDTQEKLRAQLDFKAPVGFDGYRGDATTYWYISWNWPGYGRSNCQLERARVSLDVSVTFPRWKPPPSAPPELIEKWNRYVLALAQHEANHVKNVVTLAPKVNDAIQAATCQTAEAAAQQVLNEIRHGDAQYDARTNHGETEGARFP